MTQTTLYSRATQCDGKVRYGSKRESKLSARRQMSGTRRNWNVDRRPTIVYRCPHCDYWHVGHERHR